MATMVIFEVSGYHKSIPLSPAVEHHPDSIGLHWGPCCAHEDDHAHGVQPWRN